VLLKWSAPEWLSNSDFYLLKCGGLDQSGCAAKVGADGAPPSIVFSKGAAAPLSETALVNPVLLSKKRFSG